VTIHDVAVQYEARILELQSGIAQLRLPQALAGSILTIAVGLFLALSLYAVRGQVSFLWSSLPIPFAAASARRLRKNESMQFPNVATETLLRASFAARERKLGAFGCYG
jgi:hypothetical protein